ncbi:hypothetical protein [Kitasatospora sp. NPDC088783]|uniref:hypothetical protein n=1 Tax=Kitasatospora sp. NPDC088783 TaxID=3364077 RepID=UPI003802722E
MFWMVAVVFLAGCLLAALVVAVPVAVLSSGSLLRRARTGCLVGAAAVLFPLAVLLVPGFFM